MLLEARSLPCFQLVFDVATFESSISSVKIDLVYFKYSRSSLTEPIDDSKVATSKTSWKHGRLRVPSVEELTADTVLSAQTTVPVEEVLEFVLTRAPTEPIPPEEDPQQVSSSVEINSQPILINSPPR
uniref:Uncharacterized protein n=1 Tax=Ananas comosus var. bracteatus TaxID=296719 RepID=A0A6V7PW40_ANACO|nr:unnamed protein product [Ananas comosus var. bracteatus]